MNRTAIAIRPEPGLSDTIRRAAAAGLRIESFPLFVVKPVPWELPATQQIDGVLLGSANAMRLAGDDLRLLTHLPVHAVGARTAAAASGAGFTVATTGNGGLQQLLDSLAGQKLRLLRLAGAERVPLAPPQGIELVERIVYEASPVAMPAALAHLLGSEAVVLLHSAGAASHFAQECDRLGIARGAIALAALGPRIAEAAGSGWAKLRWSDRPDEGALLALAQDMCH